MNLDGQLVLGAQREAGEGPTLVSLNPSTGEAMWRGGEASDRQVDAAVGAARVVFETWQDVPLPDRETLLRRYAQIINEQKQELARLISDEAGKPLWESATEVAFVAGKVELTIEAFHQRRGDTSFDMNGTTARTSYKPHGVLAVLGPFNFPMHLANGHIVPALLAGNAVVVKPSEVTPACGEAMVRCWQLAGAPTGLVNLLQGGRGVGEALARHEGIDGLLFTGGVAAGMALNKLFADRPNKILALELGGNNPLVVHSLADVEAAAYATVQSAYLTAGQRCTCARRLIVTDSAPVEFVATLIALIQRIRVDKPDADPPPLYGPMITPTNAERVLAAQAELIDRGGRALVEMKRLAVGDTFVSPGLIDVTDVDREDVEVFGPLLQLLRVPDLDAAIVEANNTRYGLAAGILTDDRVAYERFRRRVRAGIINWNQQLTGASGKLPFGGVGLSGNFRPSGAFAVDYSNYVVAGLENESLRKPANVIGIA